MTLWSWWDFIGLAMEIILWYNTFIIFQDNLGPFIWLICLICLLFCRNMIRWVLPTIWLITLLSQIGRIVLRKAFLCPKLGHWKLWWLLSWRFWFATDSLKHSTLMGIVAKYITLVTWRWQMTLAVVRWKTITHIVPLIVRSIIFSMIIRFMRRIWTIECRIVQMQGRSIRLVVSFLREIFHLRLDSWWRIEVLFIWNVPIAWAEILLIVVAAKSTLWCMCRHYFVVNFHIKWRGPGINSLDTISRCIVVVTVWRWRLELHLLWYWTQAFTQI